ncbi:MAG: phosphoribosylamine--glycine ligase [bacterium]|nr:phosphoribosylamine--glycine ligase [bacterium]
MADGDVLVVGNGGREHALVWKLKQSPFVKSISVASGNAGTEKIAKNIAISPNDIYALLSFAQHKKIDLTIVGPENPLSKGIVDLFRLHGLNIFGPTRGAAKIESSKVFAKKLMIEEGIATAPFRIFYSYQEALDHVRMRHLPLVVKADGLTNGKGVYICKNIDQAEIVLTNLMVERIYGRAGDVVIVEDFLEGQEISIHVLCDGNAMVIFPPSQDHKQLNNGGEGPNTGGMGAYCPSLFVTETMMFHVKHEIIRPILRGLRRYGTPFTGCLYPGLILTNKGIQVLEFNARFGDPENQVYMRLLNTDLFVLLKSCVNKQMQGVPVSGSKEYAVCIALCSKEYPLAINNPVPITGINEAERISDQIVVFHGATKSINGQLYTNGGRVLYITVVSPKLNQARELALQAAQIIKFHGKHLRTDIAKSITS